MRKDQDRRLGTMPVANSSGSHECRFQTVLRSSAVISCLLMASTVLPARADGGRGEDPPPFFPVGGGSGGTGFTGNPGMPGGLSAFGTGGGGGGGGAGGGVGGSGGGPGAGAGGAGGVAGNPDGQDGDDVSGNGGAGGGGGGYNGNGPGAAILTNIAPLIGGKGGAGGKRIIGFAGGGGGGAGGYGAVVTGAGPSSNRSVIAGGAGGTGWGGNGGDGGVAAYFAAGGATFTNAGVVIGGAGGSGGMLSSRAGSGGAGAFFAGSRATLANSGTLVGGAGGDGGRLYATDVSGGDGAYFAGGGATFTNAGVVTGGAGGGVGFPFGGRGGAGTSFAGTGASFVNSGVVAGGAGARGLDNIVAGLGGAGGAGASFTGAEATFTNSGTVTGGAGGGGGRGFHGGAGGAGGTGAYFSGGGATFTNSGTVTGGAGGNAGGSSFVGGGVPGVGGAGVSFAGAGATFVNSGTVTGGVGGLGIVGTAGGAGVTFTGVEASFTNAGIVAGGVGGRASGGTGGRGGEGVVSTKSGAILTNSGMVTGGAGGAASPSGSSGIGGSGGIGASFTGTGATLLNFGTVSGGVGGVGIVDEFGHRAAAGIGGVGIVGTGLTIINSGTIEGGLSGDGRSRANAITLSGGANILELRAGSTIMGNVVGTGFDTFRLGGASNGRFDVSGIATQYLGFDNFQKSGASTWTLEGSTNALMPWSIERGVLSVSADASLGAATGGLTFNGGTLQFGAGFDLSNSRAITLDAGGGTIDTNGWSTTIGSTISGVGSMTKVGAGSLTLSAVNTYTGQTNIDQGVLVVDGSIVNSTLTSVNNGGTLSGVGTVGNVLVNGGGVFAPGTGRAPGTMTVAGNLNFRPGASYNVVVTGPSPLDVTGTASLAGTLNATFGAGTYLRKTYEVLHAEGGLGNTRFTRANVFGLLPNFHETLSYTSTDVLLGLTATLGAGSVLPGNPQRVADALDTYFNNGGVLPPSFVALYGLTGRNLSNALATLSGEAATGAQQIAFRSMSQFFDVIFDPTLVGRRESTSARMPVLAFAPDRALPETVARAFASVPGATASAAPEGGGPLWTSWASAFGGSNRLAGDPSGAGTHDLSARIAGVAAGLDYSLSSETILGVALAGGGTNWGLSQGLGTGRSDFFQAGTYASTRSGPAYLSGAFAFANHWVSTARFVALGDYLAGSFDGQSYGGRVEGGYHLAVPAGFTPYAAVQAQGFVMPAYSETGPGGFGLGYAGRTATDTRIELGSRVDHAVALDAAAVLILRGRLAYAHNWVSNPTLASVFQTLPGAGFAVVGAKPVTNAALVSGGVELRLAGGLAISAKFDGEFASRTSLYAGTGILRFSW